jgi:hypothetical protein
MKNTTLYFGNTLSAIEPGLQLDWRARYATELLKSRSDLTVPQALAMAEEFVDLCTERGYLKALPDDGNLAAPIKHHIERSVRAQIHQQSVGARIMEDEGRRVAPIHGLPS